MPPGRRSPYGPDLKHDWAVILDGRVHRFLPEELTSTPKNFGRQVRHAAAARGIPVKIITRKALGVFVQAHPDGRTE